jgi:hypothetical protein
MMRKILTLFGLLIFQMQSCQPCTLSSESCMQSADVTETDGPRQIKIKVDGSFPRSEVSLKDSNYYDKLQTYLGFQLDLLLLSDPRFKDLMAQVGQNPRLIREYIVLFLSNDSYMPEMELEHLLDCANSEVPKEWMNDLPCQNRLSSGFIASSQVNRTSALKDCKFDPVSNRQPEVICPNDYYLVWPRLMGPRYEFKTPYQLKSIIVMNKRDFYGATVYPHPAKLVSLSSTKKQEAVSNGFRHYLRYCSSCHSVNLSPIERARSFDFIVPIGLPGYMTVKSFIAFVHSDKPPPGAERFDPAEVTETKVAEIYSYLEYMSDRKICNSLKTCLQTCEKAAGISRNQYCSASRFLKHEN